jgi:excisionase family DNA binding protein
VTATERAKFLDDAERQRVAEAIRDVIPEIVERVAARVVGELKASAGGAASAGEAGSVARVALRFGLSRSYVHKLIREGKIVPLRIGRATRVRFADVERLGSPTVAGENVVDIGVRVERALARRGR